MVINTNDFWIEKSFASPVLTQFPLHDMSIFENIKRCDWLQVTCLLLLVKQQTCLELVLCTNIAKNRNRVFMKVVDADSTACSSRALCSKWQNSSKISQVSYNQIFASVFTCNVFNSKRFLFYFCVCSMQVMYGGRAIDNFDRRVLTTYMDEYFGDFIFDTFQPFHFYHNTDVDYKIPDDHGNKDSYVDFIEELPLSNTPEVFGLHPNAEIGYYTQVIISANGYYQVFCRVSNLSHIILKVFRTKYLQSKLLVSKMLLQC